ncbi:MAG: RDD family protein [Desulfuromonadales bacterium]|nr:RDD family protein [Desulfuromonadales bacterium]MBN2793594.1 RDD family protein [Desulfuromonadales bacterium]
MRCPKCGYTSFDHLDSCKKCGKDLVEFKARYGIKSILFPGQVTADVTLSDVAHENETADAAVAAATGVAAATAVAAAAEETGTAGSDDFGFDFMGDSAEDDDLSFDELFEEAPEDEDVEETIEGPKGQAEAASEEDAAEDFSFDLPDEEGLDDDFGFDPSDDALHPEDEEEGDFSFNDDEDEEESGNKEGPQNPFELPESPEIEGTPDSDAEEHNSFTFVQDTEEQPAGETGDLFAAQGDSALGFAQAEEKAVAPKETVSDFSAPLSAVAAEPAAMAELNAEEAVKNRDEEASGVSSGAAEACSDVDDQRDVQGSRPPLANQMAAFLCDVILLCLVGVSFIVAAEAAMATEDQSLLPTLETLIDLSVPYFLVLFALTFGYFTLFHFLAGQTPGKMLFGLRVETSEGEPLSFGHAFLRSVGGLLQLLPAGLGYLAMLIRQDGRGWNDRLAGTRVISLKDLPQERP